MGFFEQIDRIFSSLAHRIPDQVGGTWYRQYLKFRFPHVTIYGATKISMPFNFHSLGKRVLLNNVNLSGSCKIGDYTGINGPSILASSSENPLTIGKFCSIGDYFYCFVCDYPSCFVSVCVQCIGIPSLC